jgi:hypothetical protein
MTEFPRLRDPILWLLGAAICLILAWSQTRWSEWLRVSLVVVGVILAVAGVFDLVNWLVYAVALRMEQVRTAMAITERAAILTTLSHMDAAQIATLNQYAPVVAVLAGQPGPIYSLVMHEGGPVPMAFVNEFIDRGTDTHLAAVRQWSAETRERGWADQLTAYLVLLAWAVPSVGNQPAKWVDRAGALRSIGVEKVV